MDPDSAKPGDGTGRVGTRHSAEARYELEHEIARGGMGRVYRVRDRQLGRALAMKVLDPRDVDEHLLARFLEEARLTSQLDHPGIVPVHDVGELEDGRVFYTMPLVAGQTLAEVLERMRAGTEGWTRTRVLHALLKACEALSYAHARGVVHRDLKPANLMIGPHGEVLVMDWGLARRRMSGRAASPSGTPATMAPEVLTGATPAGPRADVYSFGAILYALCAGRLPYADLGSNAGLDRILAGPPTPIAQLAPTTPRDLVAIVEKAMARDLAERYASMDELRAELERFAEGRIVAAHPVGRYARVKKWARRHPQLAVSLGVVFVLLFALAVVQADKIRSVARAHDATLRRAFAANLSAAEMSLQTREIAEAKRRLAACDPALRGWEWRHLWSKADSAERVIAVAPGEKVQAVAVSPDGSTIASGAGQYVVLWSANDGERVTDFEFDSEVRRLAYASGGATIAAGLADGSILRLDARELTERSRTQAFPFAVDDLALSANGTTLAALSVSTDAVRIEREGFDALVASVDNPTCIAFVHDGVLAVGTSDKRLLLLDTRDLSVLTDLELPISPRALAVRPGAEPERDSLLAIGGVNGRLATLDLASASIERVAPAHDGIVSALVWSDDGAWIASASDDKTLAFWDAETCALLARRYGHEAPIKALVARRDLDGVVSGADDGTARTWRIGAGAEAVLPGHVDWVVDVASCGGGGLAASIDWAEGVRVWRIDDAAPLRTIELGAKPHVLARSAGAERLACATGSRVVVLDPRTGDVEAELPLEGGHALALEWLSDDPPRLVAWTSRQRLLVLEGGAPPRALLDHVDFLDGALAVHPGRGLVAVGTPAGDVLLVDAEAEAPTRTLHVHASTVTALAFAPDGERLLVGARDGAAVVLAVDDDGGETHVLATLDGHDDRVTAAAFAPDGARLFTGSKDRTVRVWSDGEPLLVLRGHDEWITALDVDPTGETVMSASQDGTVRLWRATATAEPRTR